ncbi:MAG: DnaJ domain-containing protein [Desulfovibrio sp.]|jgi:molecular chaperone DnaJ|nr:DnaJ domain-containing protein [Desulfovibrio sp.]
MRRRTRQISLKGCYAILKIERGADLEVLKKAYRQRAFELHPDLNPDKPGAGRQFQILNEAYVALLCLLRPADAPGEQADAARQDAKNAREGRDDTAHDEERTQTAQTASGARGDAAAGEAAGQNPGNGPRQETGERQEGKRETQNRSEKAGNAYEEQDVLRDLLNDPFARRVFEDIYSELGRQQADSQQESRRNNSERIPPPPPDGKSRKNTKFFQSGPSWDTAGSGMEFNRGVKGIVTDWLRRQIDENQTLCLPSGHLAPGRRIRLQIRHGLSDEAHTVEITLPPDFAIGRPVRLRGLGRRIGPWQGDLYLTLYNE